MAEWKQTFRIDDVWHKRNGECGPEQWTDKTVHELGKEMARRIKRKWPQHMIDGDDWDPVLDEVHDLFHTVRTPAQHQKLMDDLMSDPTLTDEEYSAFVNETPMWEFNQAMAVFYDWCDRNRVWVTK